MSLKFKNGYAYVDNSSKKTTTKKIPSPIMQGNGPVANKPFATGLTATDGKTNNYSQTLLNPSYVPLKSVPKYSSSSYNSGYTVKKSANPVPPVSTYSSFLGSNPNVIAKNTNTIFNEAMTKYNKEQEERNKATEQKLADFNSKFNINVDKKQLNTNYTPVKNSLISNMNRSLTDKGVNKDWLATYNEDFKDEEKNKEISNYKPVIAMTPQEKKEYYNNKNIKFSQKLAHDHPVLQSIGTTLIAPVRGTLGAASTVNNVVNHAIGQPLDTKSSLDYLQHSTNETRKLVNEEYASKAFGGKELPIIGNVGSFLYNTSLSIGDNVANLITGKVLVGGSTLSDESIRNTTSKVVSGIMASDAAASNVIANKEKGYTDSQALALGVSSGIIEALTEKYSLDEILKTPKSAISGLARSFVAEGSEEFVSDIANAVVDYCFVGDESDFGKNVKYFEDNGYNKKDAVTRAIGSQLLQATSSFIAGGISGVGMGIANTAGANIMNSFESAKNAMSLGVSGKVYKGMQSTDEKTASKNLKSVSPESIKKIVDINNEIIKMQKNGTDDTKEYSNLLNKKRQIINNIINETEGAGEKKKNDTVIETDVNKLKTQFPHADIKKLEHLAQINKNIEMLNKNPKIFETDEKNANDLYTMYTDVRNNIVSDLSFRERQIKYEGVEFASQSDSDKISDNEIELFQKICDKFNTKIVIDSNLVGEGMYKDGIIYLNPNSTDTYKAVFTHELVHHAEASALYDDFKSEVFKCGHVSAWAQYKGYKSVEQYKFALKQTYSRYYNVSESELDSLIEKEVVANYISDLLTQDKDYLSQIVQNDSSFKKVARYIHDFFVNLINKITLSKSNYLYVKNIIDKFESVLYDSADSTHADGAQYKFLGKNKDNIEFYITNDDVKEMSYKERIKAFSNLMSTNYRGRTAKFKHNGNIYYAQFDEEDVSKNIYGDKHSDNKGWKSKINVGASGDIFELVENSKYHKSKSEQGKNTPSHKDVESWDYYVKRVKIDDSVFDVYINIRKKPNAQFVYSISLNKNKNVKVAPLLDTNNSVLNPSAHNLDNNSITEPEAIVNTNSMKNKKNYSENSKNSKHKISDETIRNNYTANTFDYEERATYEDSQTIQDIQTDKTVHISKADVTKWQCATNFKGNHLGGVSSSKDLSRNLDSIAGTNKMIRAFLKNEIETPFFRAKANFANDLTSKVDEFYHTVVELYGIKKGSKESAALQWYGEGERQYFEFEDVDGKRKKVLKQSEYTLAQLKRDFPQTWYKIVAADTYCRKIYNQYVKDINDMLIKIYPNVETTVLRLENNYRLLQHDMESRLAQANGNKELQDNIRSEYTDTFKALEERIDEARNGKRLTPRKDYYHHFNEMSSGLVGLSNIFHGNFEIDPKLAGVSEGTRPKSTWKSFMQERNHGAYTADAVGGMCNYMYAAEYKLHFDPIIFNMRKIIKSIATATQDTKNANKAILWLTKWTNDIAGKTNFNDRALKEGIGRKLFAFADELNNRTKSNAITFNLSSALVQVCNFPNLFAYVKNPQHLITGGKAYTDYLIGKNNDILKSGFLNERYMNNVFDKFDTSFIKNTQKFGNTMLEFGDRFSSQYMWYCAYEQGKSKNVSDPVYYADDIVRRCVAGRGVGDVPLTQKSLLVKYLMPFQVEVNNSFNLLKETFWKKDLFGLALIFGMYHVFNLAFRKILGRDVLPDLPNDIKDVTAVYKDKKGNFVTDTIAALFTSFGRISNYSAYGNALRTLLSSGNSVADEKLTKFFGEGSSRYGMSNIALTSISKAIFDCCYGDDIDYTSLLTSIVTPFGGKQIEKTTKALQDYGYLPNFKMGFNNGARVIPNDIKAHYNSDGSVAYLLDPNVFEKSKALMFGVSATDSARDYYDGNKSKFTPESTEKMRELKKIGINEYVYGDFKQKVSSLDKVNSNSVIKIIDNMNLTDVQKNSLYSSVNPNWKASYFEVKAKKPMDNLSDLTSYISKNGSLGAKNVAKRYKKIMSYSSDKKSYDFLEKTIGRYKELGYNENNKIIITLRKQQADYSQRIYNSYYNLFSALK